MPKNLNAEKRFSKVANRSDGAVAQFHSTIESLEHSNFELLQLSEEINEEMDRLQGVLESTSQQINSNTTTIQGLKNLIGE